MKFPASLLRITSFGLRQRKKCCHNTATKYLKNFKKIIRIALAKGWMKNDPFLEIRFSLDKVEPDFLEDSEIQKLISKEIDIPRLSQVRDIFCVLLFHRFGFLGYSWFEKGTYRGGLERCQVDTKGETEDQNHV